jgi:hypothetical protein
MKKTKKRKQKTSLGIYGINANKSRVPVIKSTSDLSTKVKYVK